MKVKDNIELAERIMQSFAGNYSFIGQEQEIYFFSGLAKLPEDVIEFAKDIYFCSDPAAGFYAETFLLTGKNSKQYKAIVNFKANFWKLSDKKRVDGIAHEIAHVYLGHEWGETHQGKKEIDANNLATEWIKQYK
ncbi:MAG TPA: hypothetical protein VM077_03365 [Candidatus Limnocylindrales bacterium]|nr:hypothetical protein [Candidatus Limnocylindrales bacterium]